MQTFEEKEDFQENNTLLTFRQQYSYCNGFFLDLALKSLFYSQEKKLTILTDIIEPNLPKNLFEANENYIYTVKSTWFSIENDKDIHKFIAYIFNIIQFRKIDIVVRAEKTINIKIEQIQNKKIHSAKDSIYTLKFSDFNYILEKITELPIYYDNLICQKIKYSITDDLNGAKLNVAFSKFNNDSNNRFFKYIHNEMFVKQLKEHSLNIDIELIGSGIKNKNYSLVFTKL